MSIDDLEKQLRLVRGEVQELTRRGYFGRVVNDLKFEAVKLDGVIRSHRAAHASS